MDEEAHHRFLNGEVDKALDVLCEFFDAAQFIATYVDDNGQTHHLSRGRGNWYARIGATMEFIECDTAQTTARAIGEVMVDEDEED